MLLIVLATVATVILLRFIIQESFSLSDAFVSFLMNNFKLPEMTAITITRFLIYNNMEAITLFIIIVFLVIMLKISISWFTGYFDEVITGVDKLAGESPEEIVLSPELDFMEKKLNQIKSNLEKQKKLLRMRSSVKMILSFTWLTI